MPATIRPPTAFDVARLLLVGAIWGASFPVIAVALQGFGPLSISALRVSMGGALLLALGLLVGQTPRMTGGEWRLAATIGLLNSAAPFFLISWGQQFISSAESALLMATGTFCALLFSHFSTRDERVNWARGLGTVVGFGGVAVLVIVELLASGLGGIKGQIAVMLAGACYAASSVLARRVGHLPTIATSAAIMLTAAIYMLPSAMLFEGLLAARPGWAPALAMLFLGVVATAFAFSVRFTIIRDNGAVFMSQVGYLVPLFGVIWGWLFRGGGKSGGKSKPAVQI